MLSMVRAVFLLLFALVGDTQADIMHVSGWGGVYGEVYDRLVLQPFAVAQDIEVVHEDTHTVSGADVVEVTLMEAVRGCDNGEFLWLSPRVFESIGSVSEYVPNAVQPCAIAQWSWATVVGYSAEVFSSATAQPTLMSDFFNTTDFPGKRVLRRSPLAIAVWALNVSGVPASDTYEVLSNPKVAWPIIEKQLRQLENDILWVESDAEAISHLRDGNATFAMLNSTNLMREMVNSTPDLRVMWDAALLQLSMLVIPANSQNPHVSMELLSYINESENSLEFAAALGFGPVKYEASRLIDLRYRKYLPVEAANFTHVIWNDSGYWQSLAGLEVIERFAEWSESVLTIQSLAMFDPAEIAGAGSGVLEQFGYNTNFLPGANF